ncbi:hypothetical protein BCR42DRAFT_428165 [Absidia repens]|uniref:Uncharacterized protein n=1 Tax=Absidia repens TaxID=90262 RepID=A0A1X2HYC8_9FUNG|nr:hypothetical protein BCR42DRAFT_428165 [Absidia repens]
MTQLALDLLIIKNNMNTRKHCRKRFALLFPGQAREGTIWVCIRRRKRSFAFYSLFIFSFNCWKHSSFVILRTLSDLLPTYRSGISIP